MKRLLLLSITLAVAAVAGVPPATARDVRIGFRGGLSHSRLWTHVDHHQDGSYSYRSGLVLGADVVVPLYRSLSLQPGLFYTSKGARYSYCEDFARTEQELTFELDYIEVPLLLRLADGTGFFALLGPTVAFNVGSRVHGAATAKHGEHSETIRVDEKIEAIRTFDLGATYGLGAEWPVRGVLMALEIRFTLGLTSIEDPYGMKFDKNMGFLFMAGVRL